ncbi:MAG: hypothetical protein KU37_08120 [Sulfuricurvum sp. PC08-66]|nr:MAG: hypothetical protein KU37_08120 [Sulfuricurvum sp. PC08-66]
MAKRLFKTERLQTIIANIAADFRYSNEVSDYALLFYKAQTEGAVHGADIDKMIEYVTTGLEELHKDLEWRKSFLTENSHINETKLLENMYIIEQEYTDLLAFLTK